MTDVNIYGQIRGAIRQYFISAQQNVQPVLGDGGEQIVNQGLPERSELVKLGNSWGVAIPTASAFTFVAAWPTTRAELVIFNGEDDGAKTYVIDRAWMVNITSMAAAQPLALLGQVVPAALAIAQAADNAAIIRTHLSGKLSNYNGRGTFALANTAFALANKWTTLGSGLTAPMTTNLGCSIEANVLGRYLIPPGGAFCLAGLAGTAAGTAIIGCEFHEVQLNLP